MDRHALTDHLAQARAAHRRYQEAEARMEADGSLVRQVLADPIARRAALQEAFDHRQAAHALDPAHLDPIWRAETLHDALLAFYQDQLARS